MQATALHVAGAIFLFISIMQMMRVIMKVKIVVNDKVVIPLWVSMIASPVLFLLAIYMFLSAK